MKPATVRHCHVDGLVGGHAGAKENTMLRNPTPIVGIALAMLLTVAMPIALSAQ
jgi:hypothetical protein